MLKLPTINIARPNKPFGFAGSQTLEQNKEHQREFDKQSNKLGFVGEDKFGVFCWEDSDDFGDIPEEGTSFDSFFIPKGWFKKMPL